MTPSPNPWPSADRTPAPPGPPRAGAPAALALAARVEPEVVGPRDEVSLVVDLANVSRAHVGGVRVDVEIPGELAVLAVDGGAGSVRQGKETITLAMDGLQSGTRYVAAIRLQVAEDVWPGRVLTITCTAGGEAVPSQAVTCVLVLPWAELPATGWVDR